MPASAAGRCSGVIVRNVNVPWRSGLPSGVRGRRPLADWPAAEGTDDGDGQDADGRDETWNTHRESSRTSEPMARVTVADLSVVSQGLHVG